MSTIRFDLPVIASGQLNGWASHNEAMIRLEFLMHPWVVGINYTNTSGALEGEAYALGASPSGAWSGHGGEIAIFYNGWRYIEPFVGMRIYSREVGGNKGWWVWSGSAWVRGIFDEIAQVALLDINISNPPTQAEANAIKDKINGLITACRTAGVIAT